MSQSQKNIYLWGLKKIVNGYSGICSDDSTF